MQVELKFRFDQKTSPEIDPGEVGQKLIKRFR